MTTAAEPVVGVAAPNDPVSRFLDAQKAFAADAGATAPNTVQSMRAAAAERLAAGGFPTPKNEDWHFTSVAPLLEHDWTPLVAASGDVRDEELARFRFGGDWHTLVFVNGRYAPEMSSRGTPKGVQVLDLQRAWRESPQLVEQLGQVTTSDGRAFTALNTAFMHDGAVVHIAKDAEVATPIHLMFVTDAHAAKGMVSPRTLIVAGRNSRATVLESYVSVTDALYFTNAVTEVVVGDGATLHHYKIQREGKRAFHVGTIEAVQGRDSHYVSFSFAEGASLSRTNVYTSLDGEGGGTTLNGLYLLDGEQHCDHQTSVVHAQPNCFSRELYKGILDERSHGVFNGKVYVHPIAQKTDGKQTNNALLLSRTAQVDTKPQLEIFADDVKCTHGATVGRLDEVALFYMKSRGIGAATARELLIYAFAADVLETIDNAAVRESLEAMTLRRYTHA